jgi:hypothetical protein
MGGLLLTIITVYLALGSHKDAESIVQAITQQTIVIENIAQQYKQQKTETPSSHKSERKAPTIKNKLKRRTQVTKGRRERLKEKRLTFGGARTH